MSISGLANILSTRKPLSPFSTSANPSKLSSSFDFHGSCRVNFRVCAKTKDLEVKLTDSGPTVNSIGQFSAPVRPPGSPRQSKEEADRENYYLNLGYAIRSLREDFPDLFYKEPSFDIYRNDIVFKDPLNQFVGIENYKSIFWALRFHGRIFFKALWIDMSSIWQPMEGVIMVRWTVHGIPRVPWESRGRFDGSSEYKLDENGKIYQHKVDNIAINSPPKFRVMGVEELIQSLGCPSTPKPTCFEISSSSTSRFALSAAKFTPLRDCSSSARDSRRQESESVESS